MNITIIDGKFGIMGTIWRLDPSTCKAYKINIYSDCITDWSVREYGDVRFNGWSNTHLKASSPSSICNTLLNLRQGK